MYVWCENTHNREMVNGSGVNEFWKRVEWVKGMIKRNEIERKVKIKKGWGLFMCIYYYIAKISYVCARKRKYIICLCEKYEKRIIIFVVVLMVLLFLLLLIVLREKRGWRRFYNNFDEGYSRVGNVRKRTHIHIWMLSILILVCVEMASV